MVAPLEEMTPSAEAGPGVSLVIRAEGEDEAEVVEAAAALFERRFDEDS